MPDKRYYHTKKHKDWRQKVLKRDKYLCQECKKYGKKTQATHAHHIKSVEDYPELSAKLENGISLCTACHNRIEPRPPLSKKRSSGVH